MATGCFYCDEHHEGREAIMFKVGEMKAGVLYLFKDQAHKGRCALALKNHRKELCECEPQELADFAQDLARASGAIKELWGCTKINLGSFGDTNPHLHFHIIPRKAGDKLNIWPALGKDSHDLKEVWERLRFPASEPGSSSSDSKEEES